MRIIEPDESIFERLPSAHTAGTCTLHSYCVASRQLQWLPSLPPHSKWQRGINTSLSIPYPMSNFESPLLSRIRFPLWPTLIRDTHDLSSKMTIFIYFIVSLAFKVTGFLGMKSWLGERKMVTTPGLLTEWISPSLFMHWWCWQIYRWGAYEHVKSFIGQSRTGDLSSDATNTEKHGTNDRLFWNRAFYDAVALFHSLLGRDSMSLNRNHHFDSLSDVMVVWMILRLLALDPLNGRSESDDGVYFLLSHCFDIHVAREWCSLPSQIRHYRVPPAELQALWPCHLYAMLHVVD